MQSGTELGVPECGCRALRLKWVGFPRGNGRVENAVKPTINFPLLFLYRYTMVARFSKGTVTAMFVDERTFDPYTARGRTKHLLLSHSCLTIVVCPPSQNWNTPLAGNLDDNRYLIQRHHAVALNISRHSQMFPNNLRFNWQTKNKRWFVEDTGCERNFSSLSK